MAKKFIKVSKKYGLFLLAFFTLLPSLVEAKIYNSQLIAELAESAPSPDLNLEAANLIVTNSSFLDYVHAVTSRLDLFMYIVFIAIGLQFVSEVRNHIDDNSYYILRSRLSYYQYLKLVYKKALFDLFKILSILTIIIYLVTFALGGLGGTFELLIESFIPFFFLFIYSALVMLIVINVNFVISNRFVIYGLPFAILYAPVLISTLLNKLPINDQLFIASSYQTFVPTLSYTASDTSVNLVSYIQGNLSAEQTNFLFQYVEPFIVPYLILIVVFALTTKLGKDSWYV